MSLLSRLSPLPGDQQANAGASQAPSAEEHAQASHTARTRIRGARKADKGKSGTKSSLEQTQEANGGVANQLGPTQAIDIRAETSTQTSASISASDSHTSTSVSPRKRRGGHPSSIVEGEMHLTPLGQVSSGPPGRDTTSSRWATAASSSPPKSTAATKHTAAAHQSRSQSEDHNINDLSVKLEGLSTNVQATLPPVPSADAPDAASSRPKRRTRGQGDGPARPALGGRSRWATATDDVDETVYDAAVFGRNQSKNDAATSTGGLKSRDSEGKDLKAETVSSVRVDSAPETANEAGDPLDAADRPSTPTRSPPFLSSFTSPSQHIDWADDDDDELPPIDDWIQEGQLSTVEDAPAQREPSTTMSIFGSAMSQATSSAASRQSRTRTISNASDVSSAPSATSATGARRNRRRSKGHGDKPDGLTPRHDRPPSSRRDGPQPPARSGGRDPAWRSRAGEELFDSPDQTKRTGRRARGGRGGGKSGAGDDAIAAKKSSAPVGPSAAAFARLSGIAGPKTGTAEQGNGGTTRRRGGERAAGAPDGRSRW
ncbi:hypothetical protein ACM66B_001012 [Microbotryomycetes sp. NB124-2]